MPTIRMATLRDASALARLHLIQTGAELAGNEADDYLARFETFLNRALSGGHWLVWVAQQEEELALSLYVTLVQRLPHPGRSDAPAAFITQLDALPGALQDAVVHPLMRSVVNWARSQRFSRIHTCPSLPPLPEIDRLGFVRSDRAWQLELP